MRQHAALTIVRRNIKLALQSLVAVNTLLGCFLPRLSRAISAVFFDRSPTLAIPRPNVRDIYSAASGRLSVELST